MPIEKYRQYLVITCNEKLRVFQYLFETFQSHNVIFIPQHIEYFKSYLYSPLPNVNLQKYLTPNKVKNKISKYSRNKSSGFNKIMVKVARYEYLTKNLIIVLIYIYNVINRLSYFQYYENSHENYVCRTNHLIFQLRIDL